MVERGPFKSEVEGSIPSALTSSQISVLDTDAPFFTFPSSFVMLSAAKHLGSLREILRFAQDDTAVFRMTRLCQDDTALFSVLPTFNEKREVFFHGSE